MFFGFEGSNCIYHAIPEDWQQFFGFNDFYYDVFYAANSRANEKFEFSSCSIDYILWAWKGDYLNLGAGAELEIYSHKSGIAGVIDVPKTFNNQGRG